MRLPRSRLLRCACGMPAVCLLVCRPRTNLTALHRRLHTRPARQELIKYAWPEDIWYHVDKESSAHVYIRLPRSRHATTCGAGPRALGRPRPRALCVPRPARPERGSGSAGRAIASSCLLDRRWPVENASAKSFVYVPVNPGTSSSERPRPSAQCRVHGALFFASLPCVASIVLPLVLPGVGDVGTRVVVWRVAQRAGQRERRRATRVLVH